MQSCPGSTRMQSARRVAATMTFKGKDGCGVFATARQRLAAHGWSYLRIKHLERHHNESVILAAR